MKLFIASDHAGFSVKHKIVESLKEYSFEDCGPATADSVDYPDFAQKLGQQVACNPGSFGVLICGTGIGISIAANKIDGIRAALITNQFCGKAARQHNNANVACFGARVTGIEVILASLRMFLSTEFEGGRHQRRVAKISALEQN